MKGGWSKGEWASDGLAEWIEGDTAYLSIAFSWRLPDAHDRARFYRAMGYRVRAGGPGLFTRPRYLEGVAETGGALPGGALTKHNSMATKASDGCPVGCFFCIVPAMEGRQFTLLPEFTPRPVLTDNNLSALPSDYQAYIVDRYQGHGVPLLDANSGFEPKTFDAEVFERWRLINRGPWRFGSDETMERADVQRVIRMLRERQVSSRKIQVYTMIGHEPFAECMARIQHVIDQGGEPYVQPIMKLNALAKEPWLRHDWSPQLLRQVQRWANRHLWRDTAFADYRASAKTSRDRSSDAGDLFSAAAGAP